VAAVGASKSRVVIGPDKAEVAIDYGWVRGAAGGGRAGSEMCRGARVAIYERGGAGSVWREE
jgi:hypothetical protein